MEKEWVNSLFIRKGKGKGKEMKMIAEEAQEEQEKTTTKLQQIEIVYYEEKAAYGIEIAQKNYLSAFSQI